ncbi:MAG: FkbM family methyltransferase [Planctomycetota bacterium]
MLWDPVRWRHRAWRYRLQIDPDEIRFVRSFLRPGQSAIDLGAHKGGYTYWMAKAVGARGRVLAVEPQKSLADRLARLTAHWPQVVVRNAAVSDVSGAGEIVLRSSGSTHGASLTGFPDGDPGKRVPVQRATLSELARDAGLERVHFVKCDIEGHELAAFGGSRDLVDRDRPTIICECEERHAHDSSQGVGGLVRLFEPLGYRIRLFYRHQLIDVDRFDPKVHQVVDSPDYGNNWLLEPKTPRA